MFPHIANLKIDMTVGSTSKVTQLGQDQWLDKQRDFEQRNITRKPSLR